LKTISKDHSTIDQAKVEDDARFDGTFVLRTNTDLNACCSLALTAVAKLRRTGTHASVQRPHEHPG
jgi:hypothetical protein